MDPTQLKFARTHEWLKVEGNTATVGISDFAVKELTDLVYIQLPAVGSQVTAGDGFGEVESVKAVSDLYSPVNGKVIAVNEELPDNLAWLGEDPYGKGWIVKIELDGSPSTDLMNHADYQAFCQSAGH